MTYMQFKLTSGEEILCQVLEDDEDDVNIVVRQTMEIIAAENFSGMRFYTFRPWMTYQVNSEYMQLVNTSHIVGEAKPDKLLLQQYLKVVEDAEKDVKEKEVEFEKKYEQLMEKIDAMHKDDSKDNVIHFNPDKSKLH